MARIKSYIKDKSLNNDDMLVGSSYEGEGQAGPIYKTRNYRLEDLAKYMNLVFTVDEVNYNLVTITNTINNYGDRLDGHDNLFIDNSNFLLNLTSEFGEFDEFGNLISLSQAFANLLITTTTSARFAEAQYVLNLGASVGLYDPNGNLIQLSTAFADQVITATASDRFARTTFVTNLASSFGTYDADGNLINFNNATFLDSITTYVDADLALSTQLTSLTASVNTNAAAITTESTARATADSALASQITSLTATVNSNTAAITTESTVRADGDSALASQITTLTATVNNNTAAITTESTVRANGDSALASQITTLTATVNNNTAAITSEATARANADGALSSQINTVSAVANGNTANITTNATAIATVDGKVNATYSLQVDANGNVAGLKLGANNYSSEFIATADTFGVNMPNGTRVLTVNASGLSINGSGTFSGTLSAASGTFTGSLSAASGTFTTLSASNLKLSQNQILFDNSGSLASAAKMAFTNTSGNIFAEISAIAGAPFGDALSIAGSTGQIGTLWTKAQTTYFHPATPKNSGAWGLLEGYFGNDTSNRFSSITLDATDNISIGTASTQGAFNTDYIFINPSGFSSSIQIKSTKDIFLDPPTGYEVNVSGDFSVTVGSKNFKITHPLAEDKWLVHASIESPEVNNIYRGKTILQNGYAEINLDQKFNMTEGTILALNKNFSVFTSNETSWDAVRGKLEGNVLKIECQNQISSDEISWMVVGTRKDDGIMQSGSTDANGDLIVEKLKQQNG